MRASVYCQWPIATGVRPLSVPIENENISIVMKAKKVLVTVSSVLKYINSFQLAC